MDASSSGSASTVTAVWTSVDGPVEEIVELDTAGVICELSVEVTGGHAPVEQSGSAEVDMASVDVMQMGFGSSEGWSKVEGCQHRTSSP